MGRHEGSEKEVVFFIVRRVFCPDITALVISLR